MKILYVTTVGATMGFFKSYIKQMLDAGHTVDIACNDAEWAVPDCFHEWNCRIFQVDCSRNPLSRNNIKATKRIKTLVKENGYDIVHCHTPVAALCARTACRKLRKTMGVRVIYTAHGFHFFKGAPLKNWLLFYPLEWICAHWTDVLVTINTEDYAIAKKKMPAKKVEYVPGVGIDIDEFAACIADKAAKRREIGIPEEAFMLMSVGELNENKNHGTVLKAMAQLSDESIHYAIAGKGELDRYLSNLAEKLGLAERFHLLGFRNDVPELYKTADAFIHPSLREGLPVSVMEAIAAHLPVLCSDIRGARDLVDKKHLFNPNDVGSVAEKIKELANGGENFVEFNYKNLQRFDTAFVNRKMSEIYDMVIGEE